MNHDIFPKQNGSVVELPRRVARALGLNILLELPPDGILADKQPGYDDLYRRRAMLDSAVSNIPPEMRPFRSVGIAPVSWWLTHKITLYNTAHYILLRNGIDSGLQIGNPDTRGGGNESSVTA